MVNNVTKVIVSILTLKWFYGCLRIRLMGMLMAIVLMTVSCADEPLDPSQADLIRVGSHSITVRQFKRIQDMSQDYYWQDHDSNTAVTESRTLRLLNQMTEELLIKERAKALSLTVSDTEVDTAIQNIKSDYPEGTFEQVLLENAVSFDFWRQRLKIRLLIDKVIEKELESNVIITPEDVSAYYKKHYSGPSGGQTSAAKVDQDKDINEIIVRRLRKLKAEKNYKDWIDQLQQTYPVEVNWELWNQLQAP